jgi:hypothetical protein
MSTQIQNNKCFEDHEQNTLIFLMNERPLNNDQCYMVVTFKGIKLFINKIELEKFFVSLAPSFEYNILSELAIYLIKKGIILDASITQKKFLKS